MQLLDVSSSWTQTPQLPSFWLLDIPRSKATLLGGTNPLILSLSYTQRNFILFPNSKCCNARHIKKLWKKYINSNQWKKKHKSASPSGKNAVILRLSKISSQKHHTRLLKQQRKRYTNIVLTLFLQSFGGILRHRNWRLHFLKRKVKTYLFTFHFPHSRKTIEWRKGTDHSCI